ncbi:hypothetical protein UFOVP193_53 [uncultured Caudovirales phage]|uniref:Uncharacterized protein n=1 Tax=uncultured Caudovirales phage TaxID=2100421 RepID=A0A6J7WNS3_9CAUD|nr:hypothetical protein UFOVP193_53 [uncultured Caudovirales phage]
MADTTEQQILGFNPEIQDLSRQRKLAEMLMASGMQQPQGQMISGHYVAPSWAQQLNPLFNAAVGTASANSLDTKEAQLAEALRGTGQQEVQAILQTAQTDPKAALAMASSAKTAQGRALAQSLMSSVLPKKTDKLVEYDTYKAEGGKKTFSDWAKEITPEQQARLDLDRQRLGLEGARLGLEKEKLAAELGGGKLNNEQGQAVGFGTRAKEADAILKTLEPKEGQKGGTANTGVIRGVAQGVVGLAPFIGDKLQENVGNALNWTASENQQRTLQARKNFATAVLRKESGASISPTEFADVDRIYFPQVGDEPSVVAQKQRARDLAIQSLETQAGPGARLIKEFKPQTDFGNAPKKVVNYNDLP